MSAATCTTSLVVDYDRHLCLLNGRPVRLTKAEMAAVCALAARPGYVLTRGDLVAAIHGCRRDDDDRSVDAIINRLRNKMRAVDGDFDLIETIYGRGYRLREAA